MDASPLSRRRSTFLGESSDDSDLVLGAVVRARRHALGKTLVEVAAASELSHSFLSQLERGHARPSMRSLFLIARALETTQQALLAAATPGTSATTPAGASGIRLDTGEGSADGVQAGSARLLSHVEGGADVTEFVNLPTEFEDLFSHGRHEFVYVVSGELEIELTPVGSDAPERHVLGPRQSIGYPGATAHRYRRVGSAECVVLVIHSGPDDFPATPHDHAPTEGDTP